MLIFAQTPALVSEWRDQLALWSDILGVLGFVISVVGLVFGMLINKQVNEAREEAKKSIELAANLRTRSEHAVLTQCLNLAREAARGKSWQRLLGHLDAAKALYMAARRSALNSSSIVDDMLAAMCGK